MFIYFTNTRLVFHLNIYILAKLTVIVFPWHCNDPALEFSFLKHHGKHNHYQIKVCHFLDFDIQHTSVMLLTVLTASPHIFPSLCFKVGVFLESKINPSFLSSM